MSTAFKKQFHLWFRNQLVLLGESAVGKSSLVLRFVKGQFHEFQESTIGAAFLTQTLCLDDTTVKFEIWDTAGQVKILLQVGKIQASYFFLALTYFIPLCLSEHLLVK